MKLFGTHNMRCPGALAGVGVGTGWRKSSQDIGLPAPRHPLPVVVRAVDTPTKGPLP